jgi:hypothetical protein
MKITPSMNTASRAICQEYPKPSTTVYARNALRPIPAERAKGKFAHKAIQAVPTKDARQVARSTAVVSIPASPRMLGLTARMYAIVMKVVTPAIISVLTLAPFSLSLKSFSNTWVFLSVLKILKRESKYRILAPDLPILAYVFNYITRFVKCQSAIAEKLHGCAKFF